MTARTAFIIGIALGSAAIGLPAIWWARTQRAHADYKGAKAAVPKARAALIAAGKQLVKFALIGLTAIAVAIFAAARN